MAPKPKRSRPTKKSDPPSGDQIRIDNRGERNANAGGRGAWAWVWNVDIHDLKWQPVVVVLTVVGALLGVILWFVIPKTSGIMTRQFNIAVAEFLVEDANGNPIGGNDGELLAEYVRQDIDTQFAEMELNKTVSYEIWGPTQTRVIKGDTTEARSVAAEALAKKIHAHVLIYGIIISDGKDSKFLPEFYINHSSFSDASEITGEHEFGHQIKVALPFKDSIQPIENAALAGRVNALDLITIGLAYYSVDNFEQALSYFGKAAQEERWVSSGERGKEVVYLLIGNAYVRQASKMQEFSNLPLAMQSYQEALGANPNYGRALIGKANVLYLEASRPKNNCSSSGLDEASGLLDQASSLENQPVGANIETKVHFYRGQIAIIRDVCHLEGADWLTEAQKEFSWVTHQYEDRKESKENNEDTEPFEGIEPLASHAYARLGYIAYQRGDPQAAIGWFEKAVGIASPYYQGAYTFLIGDIYAATNQTEQAIQAYEDAIAIAESNGDGASAKKYEEKIRAIENQQ